MIFLLAVAFVVGLSVGLVVGSWAGHARWRGYYRRRFLDWNEEDPDE